MFTNVSRPSAVDVLRPFAVGDQFYADTTSTLAKRSIGSTNDVYTILGGVPVWSSTITIATLSVVDSGFRVIGSLDPTKKLAFEVDAQTTGKTLTIDTGAQTVDRTLSIPVLGGNDTIETLATAQTISGAKTFSSTVTVVDGNFSILGSSDATKKIKFEADAQGAGFTFTWDIGAQTASRTLSVPALSASDTIAALGVNATWSGLQTFGNAQTVFGLNSGAIELRVNGGNSGSNNGGRCTVWNNGSSILQFGNKSAILGGAYDATPYFYSNGTVQFADSIQMTDAKNIISNTTTGTKIATATTQKLGFWNATPVVQPATTGTTTGFTAGAGTAVNDASTFTGGTGSTAYRISDIVLALKQAGIMAL